MPEDEKKEKDERVNKVFCKDCKKFIGVNKETGRWFCLCASVNWVIVTDEEQ